MNVWEESQILPMAIRLRKSGQCPPDIDNLYGEIMSGIVRMASVLLPNNDPRYEMYRAEFLTEDVQSSMLCQALYAAERLIDTKSPPKRLVNYLVKTVQNRLRNYVRDTSKRKGILTMVTESELGYDISELGDRVSTLDGRTTYAEPHGKVNNIEIES